MTSAALRDLPQVPILTPHLGEFAALLGKTVDEVEDDLLGVAIAAPRITHSGQAVGLALIAGGALGNFADRIFRAPGFWFGHVVDYISVGSFAVFNIADAAITCGVVIFIIAMVLEERKAEHE